MKAVLREFFLSWPGLSRPSSVFAAMLFALTWIAGSGPATARENLHLVQSDMPVIPPPSQRQQQQQQVPPPAQGPATRAASIDDLARQGYDVRAIERAGQAEGRYIVMMQRAGDVKTCLMRIEIQRGAQPQRQSACF